MQTRSKFFDDLGHALARVFGAPLGLLIDRDYGLLRWAPVLGLVGCWAIIRIAFAFVQTDAQIAFGHDSAYLWIVARNVWLGLGFVNDAHWLVFLHPETLPVPFHNAAPLFSWLTAKVAATGLGLPAPEIGEHLTRADSRATTIRSNASRSGPTWCACAPAATTTSARRCSGRTSTSSSRR